MTYRDVLVLVHRRNSFMRFSHEVQRPYHVFYIKRHTEAVSFISESMTVEKREDYTVGQCVQWPVATFYAFYIIWCFSKLLPHTRQHIPFVVKGISQRTNPKIHFRVMPNQPNAESILRLWYARAQNRMCKETTGSGIFYTGSLI